MKSRLVSFGLLLIVAMVIFLPQVCFIVDERDQYIITQFGEYKRSLVDPGLALKIPFIQVKHRIDKRILESDAKPETYLTLDKKRLKVDHVTRWRIVDPLRFYKTVQDERHAKSRLDQVVFSGLRGAIAKENFDQVISVKRESIMESITTATSERAAEFGIEVIDVRVKRADLPQEVEQNVYMRMRAERERIAKRYRSEGEEEAKKIRAEADKSRTILLAKAYNTAQTLRGDGDAESARIYAAGYNQDPEFYQFMRSLEAYESGLTNNGTLFLTTDTPLLKYFQPE